MQCTICDFATAIRMGFVKHMANVHKKGVDGVDLEESVRCGQCDFRPPQFGLTYCRTATRRCSHT